jgi:hypothetical protein
MSVLTKNLPDGMSIIADLKIFKEANPYLEIHPEVKNGSLFCRRCGQWLNYEKSPDEKLNDGIVKLFGKLHRSC